jgi:hypothetical protein
LMILQVIMELKWGFNQVKEKENKFLWVMEIIKSLRIYLMKIKVKIE